MAVEIESVEHINQKAAHIMSSLLFGLGVKPRQICRNFVNLRQKSIFLDYSQKSYKSYLAF